MGEENASSTKSITTELKVYMHCDACEREVRRAIRKVEGVETIEVDREENKVTVTGGGFEPEMVVRKIKKKTGKKAEILPPEENEEDGVEEEPYIPYSDPLLYPDADVPDEFRSYRPERWSFDYFDDENAHACMIM